MHQDPTQQYPGLSQALQETDLPVVLDSFCAPQLFMVQLVSSQGPVSSRIKQHRPLDTGQYQISQMKCQLLSGADVLYNL